MTSTLIFALFGVSTHAYAEKWLVVGTTQGQLAEIDIDSIKKLGDGMREVTTRWEFAKGTVKDLPAANGAIFRSKVDCSEKKIQHISASVYETWPPRGIPTATDDRDRNWYFAKPGTFYYGIWEATCK